MSGVSASGTHQILRSFSGKRWGQNGKPYGSKQKLRSEERSIVVEMGANSDECQYEFSEGNYQVTIKLQNAHLTASWEEI